MKKRLLFPMLWAPVVVAAQTNSYTIEGAVGHSDPPGKVYLQYQAIDKTFVADSVAVSNGRFKFQGHITGEPVLAVLMFGTTTSGPNSTDVKQIYLDKGVTTVSTEGKISDAKIGGTQVNLDNTELADRLSSLGGITDSINTQRSNADSLQRNSVGYKKEMARLITSAKEQWSEIYQKFIWEHPTSYISLVALESYAHLADYSDMSSLFNGLTDSLKSTTLGRRFAEQLEGLKAVALGATAPDFKESDTSGKMIGLSSFRGQYVLVEFWASWCVPCLEESPNLRKAFSAYKGKNFTILGVSLDNPDTKGNWLAAIQKNGLIWPQVSDLMGFENKAARLYNVTGIPRNLLIDPNGKIIAKDLRGDELEAKLEKIFQ